MIDITELFCKSDDFYQEFWPQFQRHLLTSGVERQRSGQMSVSEMLTIMVFFHHSGFQTFKRFYLEYVLKYHKKEFPHAVCYARFVQIMPKILVPLMAFMDSLKSRSEGIAFIDSMHISVCKNQRIERNRVFKDVATRGRSSMGWFFGFKLHLIINHVGEIISWTLTKGNIDDRKPVRKLAKNIKGKLYADKGYISHPLFQDLFDQGLSLVTTLRSNMKNRLMDFGDRIMLKKRFLIETVNGHLKEIFNIEHSRHRSKINFLVNLVSALAAYQLKPKKPKISINTALVPLPF
jgi:hypothetical protein